jgi:hypothetical protein
MASVDPKMRVVDPEFEIFWREVGEAVRLVEIKDSRIEMTVERANRGAKVNITDNQVVIYMYEVEPKQPALMVP